MPKPVKPVKKTNGHHPRSNGAAEKTGGKKKYARTTAAGRVVKHLERAVQSVTISLNRMDKWRHSGEPSLMSALEQTQLSMTTLIEAHNQMVELNSAGWLPPKKLVGPVYREGDGVKITEKHQSKYLQIYPKSVVNHLSVVKLLETGEIAVKGKDMTSPFLVAKSHLEKRSEA